MVQQVPAAGTRCAAGTAGATWRWPAEADADAAERLLCPDFAGLSNRQVRSLAARLGIPVRSRRAPATSVAQDPRPGAALGGRRSSVRMETAMALSLGNWRAGLPAAGPAGRSRRDHRHGGDRRFAAGRSRRPVRGRARHRRRRPRFVDAGPGRRLRRRWRSWPRESTAGHCRPTARAAVAGGATPGPLPALLAPLLHGEPDERLCTAAVTGTNGKTTVPSCCRACWARWRALRPAGDHPLRRRPRSASRRR